MQGHFKLKLKPCADLLHSISTPTVILINNNYNFSPESLQKTEKVRIRFNLELIYQSKH